VTGAWRLAFCVPGNPVPKGRPRFFRGHAVTPRETRAAEEVVKLCARRAGSRPRDGEVALSLVFYRRTRQACDLDNLVKLVSDALNGVAFADDRQIVLLRAEKRIDAEHPRTEVEVYGVAE
jgi:Holliday junction resolvase RusA-like endonuclease